MLHNRYLTTPLYYVNAYPHIGHAYTTLLADVLKKYAKQRGVSVFLLTGTDEHGEKIAQMAHQQGKTPQALADEVSAGFSETWNKLGLEFDCFYRTTSAGHAAMVKKALQLLNDKKLIEFREYEGKYCVGCERFLTETELTSTGLCADHQKAPEYRKEGNYFFLMSRFQSQLIEHFEKNVNSIRPENYRGEILSFLKLNELTDLCISRPKTRLTWGIELPFDSNFVTYVWVDALMNYLVAMGWGTDRWTQESQQLWSTAVHLIGKDILRTHAVYWAALLMALDVPVFSELQVNGYLLLDGGKMSKSLGNVLNPIELETQFGQETLRFYFLKEVSYGMDFNFTKELYLNSINSSLANGLGNLVSRVMTLAAKHFKGRVPDPVSDPHLWGNAEKNILKLCNKTAEIWSEGFESLKYQQSLKGWSELVTACDLYINETKPWALVKDPDQSDRLQLVLGVCLMVIQSLAILIWPVLPEAATKIAKALSFDLNDLTKIGFGANQEFPAIVEVPKLFPRVVLNAPETPLKN